MMSQTPVERERYEARLKAQRDLSSSLKEAKLEGILEGKREGILEGKREDFENCCDRNSAVRDNHSSNGSEK